MAGMWATPSRDASYDQLTPEMWQGLMQGPPQPQPSLWPDAQAPANPVERDAFEAAALRTRAPYRNLPAPGSSPLGQLADRVTSQPSWLQRATEQSERDRAAFEAGGVPALMADTTESQDLASGFFAGTIGGKAARNPALWSPISDIRLRKPLAEMEHRYTDVRTPETKIISPEDMVGGRLILTPSDLSAANRTVTHIDNAKLDRPVVAQGGPGFPEANPGMAWASDLAVARKLDNQAARLAETGDRVYIAPMTMSPTGIDASHHVAEPLSQLVQQAPIKRADASAFNDLMRGHVPDWVSINSPKFQEYIGNLQGGMKTKALMAEKMGLAEWQKKNFPDVAAVRHAMTEPGLIDVPRNTSGMAISEYIPGQGLLDTAHRSYSKGVAGTSMGQWPDLVPFDVAAPSIAEGLAKLNAQNFAAGKKTAIQPRYHMEKPTAGVPTSQVLDQEWLDGIMKFFEMKGR